MECDQYFTSNGSSAGDVLAPLPYVTPVDDAEFLTDNLLGFVSEAVGEGRPFFAQLSLHNNHIPYISPPEYRVPYAARGLDLNHQDYYGGLTSVDAQVGRIVSTLKALGVYDNTVRLGSV